MSVVIQETDHGTKETVKNFLSDTSTELPQAIADELDRVWNNILMDAIIFCSKTLDTGALASSINVIEGGMGVGGGLGQERTPRQPISNWIFDRSIVAGDETIINPKTGKTTAMYACFTKNNFVVSNPDVIQIPEITEGELIYSNRSYKKVEGIRDKIYNGTFYKIYRYKSSLPLELTAEHRIFVIKRSKEYKKQKIELVEVQDLKIGDYLISPILEGEKDTNISNGLARLIGYFCAEGNLDKDYYVRFAFNGKEREYINDVDALMFNEFGKHSSKPQIKNGPNGGSYSLTYCSKKAVNFFKQFYHLNKLKGESGMKYFPLWVMHLPLEKQKEIICGLFRGDGLKGRNRKRFGVVSRILAEETRIILERLGFSPSFRVDKRKKSKDCWIVEITGEELFELSKIINDGVEPMIGKMHRKYCIKTNTYIAYPIRKIEKYISEQRVWDIQIADTRSLVVNGCLVKNSWVHDGHLMRDGVFWSGNPFLTDALMAHEAELEAAVEKAMKELGIGGRD